MQAKTTEKARGQYLLPCEMVTSLKLWAVDEGVPTNRLVERLLREGLANRKAKAKAASATGNESN